MYVCNDRGGEEAATRLYMLHVFCQGNFILIRESQEILKGMSVAAL